MYKEKKVFIQVSEAFMPGSLLLKKKHLQWEF